MTLVSSHTLQTFACALSALALTTGTMLLTTATPAHAETPQTAHEWVEHTQAQLNKAIQYPQFSVRKGEQGIVRLSATVMPDGTLQDVSVARSAGARSLDRAALRAIEKLDRLPPVPGATTPRNIVLQVGFGIAPTPSKEAELVEAFQEVPATAFAQATPSRP